MRSATEVIHDIFGSNPAPEEHENMVSITLQIADAAVRRATTAEAKVAKATRIIEALKAGIEEAKKDREAADLAADSASEGE